MIGDSSMRNLWNDPSGIGRDRMVALFRSCPIPSMGAPASCCVSASLFRCRTLDEPAAAGFQSAAAIALSSILSQIPSPDGTAVSPGTAAAPSATVLSNKASEAIDAAILLWRISPPKFYGPLMVTHRFDRDAEGVETFVTPLAAEKVRRSVGLASERLALLDSPYRLSATDDVAGRLRCNIVLCLYSSA